MTTVRAQEKANAGDRIRQQRESVGMKVTELAKALGVSRNTVANYEAGKTEPGVTELMKLAKTLGCKVAELLPGGDEPEQLRFAFRAHKKLRKNTQIITCVRKYFRAYHEIEELTRAKLTGTLEQYPFDPEEIPWKRWIEMAAERTREAAGIGNSGPGAIAHALESLGVRSLFFHCEGKGLDGLSAVCGDMSMVMLREKPERIERTIFSAAHELGHLVLHPELFSSDEVRDQDVRDYEKEAHFFAGCFLVPTDQLVRVWKDERLDLLPEEHALVLLKRVFNVSFECLYHRTQDAGLVDLSYARMTARVKKMLGIPGKATRAQLEPEPLDDEILQRITRFQRLVRSAFVQGKIGVAKVAEMFQISVEDAKETTWGWMRL